MKPLRRTKIVCTLGPASKTPRMLAGMIAAGAEVFRLNMSHGTGAEFSDRVRLVRSVASEANKTVAIIADLAGPKIRLGEVADGSIELARGAQFRIMRRDIVGDGTSASTNHPALIEEVAAGSTILIDDGLVQLRVESKTADELVCTVTVPGPIGSHKGLAAPGVYLDLEPLTDKDRSDMALALDAAVDWVAMSFVRNAFDIELLRDLMGKRRTPVIAKVERSEAVKAIDEIVGSADGIMVARGDLGVDLPSEAVPVLQKEIIAKCVAAGKPVITATQMLDSMIRNPRPTRAEASDVANAVFDGSDALMLSGETAVGFYPVESVSMMAGIIARAEGAPQFGAHEQRPAPGKTSVTDAISVATCRLAEDLDAAAIVTSTESGHTARAVARHRPTAPIAGVSPHDEVLRQLVLSRGIIPLKVKRSSNIDDMLDRAARAASDAGLAGPGDILVITAGVLVNRPGTTNMIKVHRL